MERLIKEHLAIEEDISSSIPDQLSNVDAWAQRYSKSTPTSTPRRGGRHASIKHEFTAYRAEIGTKRFDESAARTFWVIAKGKAITLGWHVFRGFFLPFRLLLFRRNVNFQN